MRSAPNSICTHLNEALENIDCVSAKVMLASGFLCDCISTSVLEMLRS